MRVKENLDSLEKDLDPEKEVMSEIDNRALKEIDPTSIRFFPYSEEDEEGSISKLLWFKPNSKNGRYLKWDSKIKSCEPCFKCFGCDREFEVPSALGGHLSRCPYRD